MAILYLTPDKKTLNKGQNPLLRISAESEKTHITNLWQRYEVDETLLWDTEKTGTDLSGKVSTGAYCGEIAAADLGMYIDPDTGLIHWEGRTTYSILNPMETGAGQYYIANENGVVSKSSAFSLDSAYYAIITKKSVFLSSTITYDLYRIYNVRNELSRGDFISNVIADSADAYPANGIQDGFWYVKIDY